MVVLIAYRRSERPALHGSRSVEVAGACRRVEHGTRLVVCKLFESVLVMRFGEKNAGSGVTWESSGKQALPRCMRSCTDTLGDIAGRGCETLAECDGIKRRDREDADAALVATWAAREMRSGALGRGGKCCIEDGEELVQRSGLSLSSLADRRLHRVAGIVTLRTNFGHSASSRKCRASHEV